MGRLRRTRSPRRATPFADRRFRLDRQRDGDRGEDRGQDQRHDIADRHLEVAGISHRQHDDAAIEQGEVAHHPQNRRLLRADSVGGANQLGGVAKFCACAGRGDLCLRFATPERSRCITTGS